MDDDENPETKDMSVHLKDTWYLTVSGDINPDGSAEEDGCQGETARSP